MTFIPNSYGLESADNSSVINLISTGLYTGNFVDAKEFSTANITLKILPAEECTIELVFSIDNLGTNAITKSIVVGSSSGGEKLYSTALFARYFRIRVSADQGTAVTGNVQTMLYKAAYKAETIKLDDTIASNSDAVLGRSVLVGVDSGGNYRNLNSDIFGNLKADLVGPLDAFSRIRVSQPVELFSYKQQTTDQSNVLDTIISGGGESIHVQGFPHSTLRVSANNDRVVRQQHGYSIYQAGKSLLLLFTGTLLEDDSITNARARIGYFDDLSDKTVDDNPTGDGFFFQLIGGGTPAMSVVSRSSNSSTIPPVTPVETDVVVLQDNWSIDKLDGTGRSGITADFTKRHIFAISMEWLGVGDVLMGIVIDFKIVPCHVFQHSGGGIGANPTIAYNCRGSLPVRYEIEAIGAISSPAVMRQVCSSVISEGGYTPFGPVFSAFKITGETVNNEEPIIALRINQTGTFPIRPRFTLNVLNVTLVCTSGGNVYYNVYLFRNPGAFGAGPLTGATFVNGNGDPALVESAAEYDLSATVVDITGTTYPFRRVLSGYFANNQDSASSNFDSRIFIQSDIAGNSDLVVVTAGTIGGNETVAGGIQWQEYE